MMTMTDKTNLPETIMLPILMEKLNIGDTD